MIEWIDVRDRLPNRNIDVLVFAQSQDKSRAGDNVIAISKICNQGFWPDPDGKYDDWSSPWQYFKDNYEITHWCPLPEPPKVERWEYEKLQRFKAYFDGMYGKGLEIENYHMNGETEPFNNFYEDAVEEMDKEVKR